MMIGPEPIIRILLISERLGTAPPFHELDEHFKEIVRIVRSWRSIWMILHRKNRVCFVSHAFQGVIIEIDVGQFNPVTGDTFHVHTKTMILGGDAHLACCQILYRLITTPVTKF